MEKKLTRSRVVGIKTWSCNEQRHYAKFKRATKSKLTKEEYLEKVNTITDYIRERVVNGAIFALPNNSGSLYVRQKLNKLTTARIVPAYGENKKNGYGWNDSRYFDGTLDPIAKIMWSLHQVKLPNVTAYTFRPCTKFRKGVVQFLKEKNTYLRLH